MIRQGQEVTIRFRDGGLSLLEMAVAVSLLTVIVLSSMESLLNSLKLADDTDLSRIARQAAHNELERLRAVDFALVAQDANGRTFAVAELPPLSTNADHGVVTVFLDEDDLSSPVMPTGVLGFASGDDEGEATNFDLDGDGDGTETLTNTSRYRVLPVSISITWENGQGQAATYTLNAVLSPRTDFTRTQG